METSQPTGAEKAPKQAIPECNLLMVPQPNKDKGVTQSTMNVSHVPAQNSSKSSSMESGDIKFDSSESGSSSSISSVDKTEKAALGLEK